MDMSPSSSGSHRTQRTAKGGQRLPGRAPSILDPRRYISLEHANADEQTLACQSMAAAGGDFEAAARIYNSAYCQSALSGNMYSEKLFRGPTTSSEFRKFSEALQRRQGLKFAAQQQQQQEGGGAGPDAGAQAPLPKKRKRNHHAEVKLSWPLRLADMRTDSISYTLYKEYKKFLRKHNIKIKVPQDKQTKAGYRAAFIHYFTKVARIREWNPPPAAGT